MAFVKTNGPHLKKWDAYLILWDSLGYHGIIWEVNEKTWKK